MTSKIKVNTVTTESGSTLTLGESGKTVTLASGASQTGFGRTGTVDWQTTPKTGDFTATNGEGYFINTTAGAVVMTMPSGSAGAIVSIQDYNKTFDNNSFTVTPASGEKINGGIADGNLIISTEGQGLTFVYVDSTVGWKTVHENEFTQGGSSFIVATGGTESNCGNDRIHTFTGPGTFTVSQISATASENVVSYVVIGGGGGGGFSCGGGGGGAGGFREVKSPATPYTASPLDGYPNAPNRVTVTATAFPIQVGGGGAGGTPSTFKGTQGANSNFSTIISAGGGGGGGYGGGPPAPAPQGAAATGGNGGSGGGAGAKCVGAPPTPVTPYNISGGTGNTPSTTPAQGTDGASARGAYYYAAAGGGGAGTAGSQGTGGPSEPGSAGGAGGNGVATSITGSSVTRAGGGGGSGWAPGAGGSGGGGNGRHVCATDYAPAGTANTGGGAGGGKAAAPVPCGANGGSGIVIIRYKVQ